MERLRGYCREGRAVGTEYGVEHPLWVVAQVMNGLARGDVPDDRALIVARADEEAAVATEGERVDPVGVLCCARENLRRLAGTAPSPRRTPPEPDAAFGVGSGNPVAARRERESGKSGLGAS